MPIFRSVGDHRRLMMWEDIAPLSDMGAVVVAVGLDLVCTNVEQVVAEDARQFLVDIVDNFVGLGAGLTIPCPSSVVSATTAVL
jgi:hypothetical protein